MRKLLSLLLALLLLTGCLTGCGPAASQGDTLQIVTTIFPLYDWVRQVVGDTAAVEITLLMDNGVDMHNYQPSTQDIVTLSTCDLFVYVGGVSDQWVEDALAQALNADMRVVDLLDVLGDAVVEEEYTQGMEHDHADEEEHDHGQTMDEHVWLSLRNAQTVCRHLAWQLATLDEENAAGYTANADAYIAQLEELDSQYRAAVDAAARDTLLFADRFPFRYLVEDYDLRYYAAFPGCSAETQASFDTIVFLAQKLDELGLRCVLTIDGSASNIAATVISNTTNRNQTALTLRSMQSATATDIAAGLSYLSVMESNLRVLQTALG